MKYIIIISLPRRERIRVRGKIKDVLL